MTINCRCELVSLENPVVMGILNVTPDSFYDGGVYRSDNEILNQAEKLLSEGATFLDIGAYSSKPSAAEVTEKQEIARIVPVIELITKEFPKALISVDTFRSEVAKNCVEHGAALINDISAGKLDANMMATVAKLRVPYIMMHMRGTPQTMQTYTNYNNIITELIYYFSERIATARALGISDLIVDPGFGFAKTTEQNFQILRNLADFQIHDLPILAGLSRKSMIYKTLDNSPLDALNGTSVLNMIALQNGASILRVHDVKEAIECIRLWSATYP
ncbi:MAG: dihydropteroate synthase, partial [Flavobacterium sp.]|nr:dihydropteroate synthase [Flavobacterium sp.]